MPTSLSGSATASGLNLTVELDPPDRAVAAGAAVVVRLRATETEDSVAIIDDAAVELVRTLTYAYRRANAYGPSSNAIERVVTVIDRSPLDGVAGLAPGEVIERAAVVKVPVDGPGTTAGRIIQVAWSVHVRFVLAGRPDAIAGRALVVRSPAEECADDGRTEPVEAARRGVDMSFRELSARTVRSGVPLTGTLHIAAERSVPARMVRVELVLREEVERGPGAGGNGPRGAAEDGQESQTVVARTVVACRPFAPGQWLDVPFTLEVPTPLPAPSLRLPGLRIRWELRGVVDLPLRLDPRLTLGLVGATTAPE